MQLYSDVDELLKDIRSDNADQCCFRNGNIDLLKLEFEHSNESILGLEDAFVSAPCGYI